MIAIRLVIVIILFLSISTILYLPEAKTAVAMGPVVNQIGLTASLRYDGIAPQSISLTAGKDVLAGMSVQGSTVGAIGPWTTFPSIRVGVDNYVSGLVAGRTYWWRIIGLGDAKLSDTLRVTQPDPASLTGTLSLDSKTAYLSWTNTAHYGGAIAFVSYDVRETHDGLIATITSNSTTHYNVTGLPAGRDLDYYILTNDKCGPCAGNTETSTYSSDFRASTPQDYTPTIRVDKYAVDIGKNLPFMFTCEPPVNGDAFTTTWDYGDGSFSTDQITSSHTYSKVGNFQVTCRAFDTSIDGLPNGSASLTVHVNANPTIDRPTSQPRDADKGQTVVFTTHTSGGMTPYSYNWTLPVGCLSHNATSVSCDNVPVGAVNVIVTVKDFAGVSVNSAPLNFHVSLPPSIIGLTASKTSLKTGDTTSLIVTSQDGSGPFQYSYTGLPGGCSSLNSTVLSCTPNVAGIFNVVAEIVDEAGVHVTSSPLVLTVSSSTSSGSGPGGGNGAGSPSGASSSTGIGSVSSLPVIIILALAIVIAGVLVLKRGSIARVFRFSKRCSIWNRI